MSSNTTQSTYYTLYDKVNNVFIAKKGGVFTPSADNVPRCMFPSKRGAKAAVNGKSYLNYFLQSPYGELVGKGPLKQNIVIVPFIVEGHYDLEQAETLIS